MSNITKKDLKQLLKIYNSINIDDVTVEDWKAEMEEKADNFYSKDKDEKGDAYQEMVESLEKLLEGFHEIYGILEDAGEI
jgi:hypothetical protein